jgi:hypothetical protein
MFAIHTATVDVILVPDPDYGWLDTASRVAAETPLGRRTRVLARLRASASAPSGQRGAI